MNPSIFMVSELLLKLRNIGLDDEESLRDIREFFSNVRRDTKDELKGVSRTLFEFSAFLHEKYDR